jgi:hypothetical protein
MNRFPAAAFVLAAVIASTAPSVSAQVQVQGPNRPPTAPAAPAAPVPPVVVYQNPVNAHEVQQQLREIMSAYPPSVRQVLQLDPSLMQREDYMAPYPALTAFLQQHPEVVRNPGFFFGEQFFQRDRTERERAMENLQETLAGVGFLTGFLVVISLVYALLRQALEHRRWRRQTQIQTDIHNKLFDRMTNNQELLAYIETSAGRRFLEAAPVPLAAQAPSMLSAPVARIMWSVQIGVVVVAAGIGFWIARASIEDVDLASVFQVMGSLAIAVGLGFVVSAILSWALSQRMGLMPAPVTKAE